MGSRSPAQCQVRERWPSSKTKPSLCGRPGYEPVKNLDKNNAQQAIVLEAVALALALDSDAEVGHQGSVLGHRGTLSRQG